MLALPTVQPQQPQQMVGVVGHGRAEPADPVQEEVKVLWGGEGAAEEGVEVVGQLARGLLRR